jgi:hypothetical protein
MDTTACARFALALIREGDGNLTPAQSERVALSLDDLIALVEKLPMTADGLRVVPGIDFVYYMTLRGEMLRFRSYQCTGEIYGRKHLGLQFVAQCYGVRENATRAAGLVGHNESQTRSAVCDHLPATQRYWDKKSRSWKCGRCGKRCLTD